MSTKLSGYNKKAIFYAKTTHLCYNIQKIGFSVLYRVLFMLAIAVLSPRVCAIMLTPNLSHLPLTFPSGLGGCAL